MSWCLKIKNYIGDGDRGYRCYLLLLVRLVIPGGRLMRRLWSPGRGGRGWLRTGEGAAPRTRKTRSASHAARWRARSAVSGLALGEIGVSSRRSGRHGARTYGRAAARAARTRPLAACVLWIQLEITARATDSQHFFPLRKR